MSTQLSTSELKYTVREADGFDHATIVVGGQRLHVVVEGDGPLVLLVHGFPESWFCWSKQIRPLAEAGFRVAAPDMRGYGRSAKPDDVAEYRVTELVADCVGIVEALGESEAVIMGHDWGSMVAWTAAWTRPDVFRAVVGMSVPFGGRDLLPIAGTGHLGSVPPSRIHREIAGPEKVFYQEYWIQPGGLAAELEADPRGFLRDQFFSFSAGPYPADYDAPDPLGFTPEEVFASTRANGVCLEPGAVMRDGLVTPEELPDWLAEDLDFYVGEFERGGLEKPLHWYRCMDLGWELLAPYEGKPIEQPAMFIGADMDVATMWGSEAVANFPQTVPNLKETVILKGCGHWFTREKPQETTDAMLRFLRSLD